MNIITFTMGNKIIAIHGIIGSGKDTVVTFIKMHMYLQDTYDAVFDLYDAALNNINNEHWLLDSGEIYIERFAAPLKSLISSFVGCSLDELNSQSFKTQELNDEIWHSPIGQLSIRGLHTALSDAIKTAVNDDIFASTCLERCKNHTEKLIIINDLRYPTELSYCVLNGAYLIKVQRPEADAKQAEKLKSGNMHSSEQGLPNASFDYIIRNDSTYVDLSCRVLDMLCDANLVSNSYVKWYKERIH